MIIYIEKQALEYKQTQKIISRFQNADIVFIDNYKNIFDKKIGNFQLEKCCIIAKLNSPAITEAPHGYGHNNDTSYFFKTSVGCVFDCSYCYLKGAFKNDIPVYFINYDDIKDQVVLKIQELSSLTEKQDRKSSKGVIDEEQDYELKISSAYNKAIWFYSSDYSDILGMDTFSGFLEEFIPFFEKQDGVMMEVRTKSANIKPILDLGMVPQNTEFAFSLNPQQLIDTYEKGTSSLDQRIQAINTLLKGGYKVGIRFLPLLPVRDYKNIYTRFVDEISQQIDFSKVSSNFASGLLYTHSDYNTMLKKYPKLDILYRLKKEKDGFVREEREVRDFFYSLFRRLDKKCFICLDEG